MVKGMEQLKVLLITNIISPYRIPLFNCLHDQYGFDLKVMALAEKEANREWQIAKEQISLIIRFLPGCINSFGLRRYRFT
jgi:hypothetical protein